MKRTLPVLALTGILSLATLHAVAQNHTMPNEFGPMWHHMNPEKMEQMHAKRLAELKQKLQLTAAQEGPWTTFTAAIKPPTQTSDNRPDFRALEQLPTPERIDKLSAFRKAREAQMDQRDAAIKTFYAALSNEQKITFDHAFQRHHGDHPARDEGPKKQP